MRMKRFMLAVLFLTSCLCAFGQERIKVACIGDSITYGTGLEDPSAQSYPSALQTLLGDGHEVGNFGRPGATLLNQGHRPYMAQEEYRRAIDFAADIVVIHLGINDTDPRDWPHYGDFFVRDYLALAESFRQANPSVRIIIARMTPISDRHPRFLSGTRDWHSEIQEAIETVARISGAELIDFYEPLLDYPFMFPDGLHPDAEGAGIMAHVVYSAITGDYGGLKLPDIYADNMVLQRDMPLTISGVADAGVKVSVCLAGVSRDAMTGLDGKWEVTLPPFGAGGPYSMTVAAGDENLTFHNILIGEVWLCSGQSDTAAMPGQADSSGCDAPEADDMLRLYVMKPIWHTDDGQWPPSALDSVNHLQYYADAEWLGCSPESAEGFAAVACRFGKMLRDSLRVPVGLICNAAESSPVEAWIDRRTIEFELPAILEDWTHNDLVQERVRERALTNIAGAENPLQRHPYSPCYLFEAGIHPLGRFPVRGAALYHGEPDACNRDIHGKLLSLMMDSWRRHWHRPDMPFYHVRLSCPDGR